MKQIMAITLLSREYSGLSQLSFYSLDGGSLFTRSFDCLPALLHLRLRQDVQEDAAKWAAVSEM